MFALTLHTYSGMAVPIDDGDRDDCRRQAAAVLRNRRRAGHAINVLARGHEWEIEERDDAAMIGDRTGTLLLANVGAECSECGSICDDVDRRRLSRSALRYLRCTDCVNAESAIDDEQYEQR